MSHWWIFKNIHMHWLPFSSFLSIIPFNADSYFTVFNSPNDKLHCNVQFYQCLRAIGTKLFPCILWWLYAIYWFCTIQLSCNLSCGWWVGFAWLMRCFAKYQLGFPVKYAIGNFLLESSRSCLGTTHYLIYYMGW